MLGGKRQSRAAGSVALHTSRISVSGTSKQPWMSSLAPPATTRRDAEPSEGYAGRTAQVVESGLRAGRYGHDRPRGGLAEQRHEPVESVGQRDGGADVVAQAGLDQRLREAAV